MKADMIENIECDHSLKVKAFLGLNPGKMQSSKPASYLERLRSVITSGYLLAAPLFFINSPKRYDAEAFKRSLKMTKKDPEMTDNDKNPIRHQRTDSPPALWVAQGINCYFADNVLGYSIL